MGDIIQLRSPIDINTDVGRAFVVDATRAAEGLLTDKELQEAYELTPADWIAITKTRRSPRQFGLNGIAECAMAWPPENRQPSFLSKARQFSHQESRPTRTRMHGIRSMPFESCAQQLPVAVMMVRRRKEKNSP